MLSKMMLGKMDTLENLWDIHGTYMEHLGNGNPWGFIILSNIFSIAMIKKAVIMGKSISSRFSTHRLAVKLLLTNQPGVMIQG